MMRHLRKLKGKGLTELRERTVTAIYGVLEAAGFDAVTGRVPDGLSIREGVRNILAPAALGPEGLAHGAGYAEMIIRSADRILEGKFDLLGYVGLDFGKPLPDWHFDPVSGKRSPRVHWLRINEIKADETGDKKIIWELNRHQYFVTLSQAYLITADPKYAEAVWNHFDSWCRENPAKTGVNWLSSLELAFRAISWIRAFFLLDGSGIFTIERSEQLARMLYIHARHIERFLSTYFAPNTHLTGEAIGLYYIGTFLNAGKHSKRWRELGYRILCEQAAKHIREDGSYVEQASHYARYTADIYSDLVLIRRREGLDVPEEMIERLSALKQYLEALIRPDRTFIIFGDDDGGRYFPSDPTEIDRIGPTLARLSAATGIPVNNGPLYGESKIPSLIWSLSKAEREAVGEMTGDERTMGLSAFRSGGLFAYRTPGGAEHFLFHAGPHGFLNCGHAHADAISFELSVGGRQIFIDSGTYVYTADLEMRDLLRSGLAHNCLTVDGRSPSEPDGPFSWKSTANARLLAAEAANGEFKISAATDGFVRLGVEHCRTAILTPGEGLVLTDMIATDERHEITLSFVLAPDVEARLLDGKLCLSSTEEPNSLLACGETRAKENGNVISSSWEIDDAAISPIYGKLVPTKIIRSRVVAAGEVEIETSFSW